MKITNIIILIALAIIIGAVVSASYFEYRYPCQINGYGGVFCPTKPVTVAPEIYANSDYGFNMTFPDSWKGYSIVVQNWEGHVIDNYSQTYSGPEIIIKNPQTTSAQAYQDIPIMVFTKNIWDMVSGPNPTVAVSAAPIGPAKIGENAKYVFATPPRWYGFTDAIGIDEALSIVKTFKAF